MEVLFSGSALVIVQLARDPPRSRLRAIGIPCAKYTPQNTH
eukprot:COSAG05_NODE_1739_length_4161_cov_4.587642_8_plen_40_part_01